VWKAAAGEDFALAGGDSAGRNMAAGLELRIRAEDPGVRLPDGIVVIYAVVDVTDGKSFSS
jgi:acetyl esterase/lipase